jgi:hypothetical protein
MFEVVSVCSRLFKMVSGCFKLFQVVCLRRACLLQAGSSNVIPCGHELTASGSVRPRFRLFQKSIDLPGGRQVTKIARMYLFLAGPYTLTG